MTVTVKHPFVSSIPDGSDASLVRPSNWNADHTISGLGTMAEQNANSVAVTGGTIDGTTIGATTTSTGKFTTLNASTSLTTPIVQASNSGGLSLKNSAGTTQISMGAGGGDNMSINVSTNLNGTNAQIDISPTGTGHVHINPTGVNSIQINPTYVGTMDNMTIGATTPKAITGTTVTATTFSGSGASLTSIPNSALVNSAITINGTSTSLGGSVSVGTVTSVTGTSPVVSSGGNTPAISMPAATTSVSGYLTSTDWNTFNSKGSGTVTSVTGTAPVVSSGGATPAISMAAANTTTNGYLTSTDWNTFNGKGSGTVTSVAALTLGTTGTDLSSTVATGTTTPVITLQVPTASATNRGALSAADWTTFNNKGSGTVTSVTGTAPVVSSGGNTPAISMAAATTSVNGYLTSTDWNTFNGKQDAFGSQTANYFYAAPNGSAGSPTFRAVVAADIPTLNQNTTGNAGTVTNGVYTTGSYADPTWITSLAGSKITGTISGGTF